LTNTVPHSTMGPAELLNLRQTITTGWQSPWGDRRGTIPEVALEKGKLSADIFSFSILRLKQQSDTQYSINDWKSPKIVHQNIRNTQKLSLSPQCGRQAVVWGRVVPPNRRLIDQRWGSVTLGLFWNMGPMNIHDELESWVCLELETESRVNFSCAGGLIFLPLFFPQ